MISNTSYDSNILRLHSGKCIKFKYNIAEIAEFQDVIIVRLDIPPGEKFNENVYGISKAGEIVWQIPKIEHVYGDSPYTGMTENESKLTLYNWDGLDVTIDPSSGKILSKTFGR